MNSIQAIDLIVTRHVGLVEWLKRIGIIAPVLTHATPDEVRGKHVVGILPLSLARHAASVTEVEMPNLRPEQRGKELTVTEMDAAGAKLGESLAVRTYFAVTMAADAVRDSGIPCHLTPVDDGGSLWRHLVGQQHVSPTAVYCHKCVENVPISSEEGCVLCGTRLD